MKKFIKTIQQFINESQFGNDVYEGKRLVIPDDFAIWCMDFYAEQNSGMYDFTTIPTNIVLSTKNLINSYGYDSIYRGFGVDELSDEIIFNPIETGISWTFDKETARTFSKKYENMGFIPFVAKINYSKLKYIVSMDVIMDNITQRQLGLLSSKKTLKYMENYISESEVLVFDTIKVNKENIYPTGAIQLSGKFCSVV